MRRHRPDAGLELPLRGVRPRRGRQRVRRGADPRGADPVMVDRTPPKAPTALRAAITGSRVALSWKNPKAGLAKVTVVWNAKRAPRSTKDGKAVYQAPERTSSSTSEAAAGQARPLRRVRARWCRECVDRRARDALGPRPEPLSLAPGGKLSGSPALTWNAVKGATYYNVQVFAGTQATKRVAVAWPAGTSWTLPGSTLEGEHGHVVRSGPVWEPRPRRTTGR